MHSGLLIFVLQTKANGDQISTQIQPRKKENRKRNQESVSTKLFVKWIFLLFSMKSAQNCCPLLNSSAGICSPFPCLHNSPIQVKKATSERPV